MNKESKLEAEILASFERGEWQPAPEGKNETAHFAGIASAYWLKKNVSTFASFLVNSWMNRHGKR